MNWIKKLLFKSLSQKTYLMTLHRSFYFLYNLGWLKNDAKFKYHYKIKELIKPDFTVLDIGANLGYFAKNFAKLTPKGKLIAIEPVPVFYQILQKFLSPYKHVTIYNVALGNEAGKIEMAMPESNGMIRTGLPHIVQNSSENKHKTQTVEIVKASEFFQDLTNLDYIKCDIEGYEWVVLKEIEPMITQFQPYVQIEIAEKNLNDVLAYFEKLNYTQFGIANYAFIEEKGAQKEEGDYLFVPQRFLEEMRSK